jgi:S1-C subfamily serine protease
MRKMLAIVGLVVVSQPAWALAPDRSQLSTEENATINTACAPMVPQGNDSFQVCVARQMAALKDHPTPDLAEVPPLHLRAIERRCLYLRRTGIAAYNDCLKQAIAAPVAATTPAPDDTLTPDYAKLFEDSPAETATPAPVAMTTLPKPGDLLPKRPDRIAQTPLTPAEVFKKVAPSIWVVVATPSRAELRVHNVTLGSAVAISDHLLLTNCHVVKDRAIIKLVQEGTRDSATLVAADDASDRCVLRAENLKLTPVTGVRTIESLAVGERAFAVGAPLSFERTLSEGLVSAIRSRSGRAMVQTSAAISPGSSGGGLFDERGNLIGITTLTYRVAQNLNFAIAAEEFWK